MHRTTIIENAITFVQNLVVLIVCAFKKKASVILKIPFGIVAVHIVNCKGRRAVSS